MAKKIKTTIKSRIAYGGHVKLLFKAYKGD